jgi:hypothetical protein
MPNVIDVFNATRMCEAFHVTSLLVFKYASSHNTSQRPRFGVCERGQFLGSMAHAVLHNATVMVLDMTP